MQVKFVRKLPKSVPTICDGEAASWGVNDLGMPQVNCHVSVIDAFGIRHMICNQAMSTKEARQHAASLILMADHADEEVNKP